MAPASPPPDERVNAYAGLLASPDVRRLILASTIARLPAAMLPLAILLLVVETSGSIAAGGLIAGAFGLGRAAVSPAVGALIDRAGQPRVLIVGSLVQAVFVVLLVTAARAHVNLVAVGAVAVAAGAASPPVQASLRALWPRLTTTAQRDAAYSFDATSQELIWIFGPLLVAATLGISSAATAVLAAALVGCLGVGLFAATPASRDAPRSASGRFALGALNVAGLRPLVATSAGAGFAWGALSFGVSALAVQLGQRQASGFLLAALSAGSITGGLAYGAWTWRSTLITRYRALLIACTVAAAPMLFATSIAFALPAGFLAGLPLAPLYAASYVLTGRIAQRDSMTEAFTWTSSAFAFGVALGNGISGVAAQSAGVHAAFGLACLAPLAAWFVTPLIRDRGAAAESAQAG